MPQWGLLKRVVLLITNVPQVSSLPPKSCCHFSFEVATSQAEPHFLEKHCGASTDSCGRVPGRGGGGGQLPAFPSSPHPPIESFQCGPRGLKCCSGCRRRTFPPLITAPAPRRDPIWKLEPQVCVPPPLLVSKIRGLQLFLQRPR